MQFFRRFVARLKAWKASRSSDRPFISAVPYNFSVSMASIRREVTRHGVRVFSVCGQCGASMHTSATLCEECARRSNPARPL